MKLHSLVATRAEVQPGKLAPERYPLFDYLRLLLALEVMVCHYFHPSWMLVPCVPMFLALSGFLVPGSWEHSRGWGHFAWKRFLRIIPGYTAMLLVLGWFVGPSEVTGNLVTYVTAGFMGSGFNGAVWSLGAEELAYFVLALMFLAGVYRKAVLWPLMGLGAAFMLWSDLRGLRGGSDTLAAFRVQCLPFAFFMGGVIYLHREKLRRFGFLGLGLFASGIVLARFGGAPSVAGFTAPSVLFAAPGLLLIALGFSPKLPKIPDLSLGIYLWHELWFHALPGMLWLQVGLTLTSAALSWFVIEKKALGLKDWRLGDGYRLPSNRRDVNPQLVDA